MDDAIIISNLNDYIFCPASIYFHNLYGSRSTITYQSADQINGTKAHETVDNNRYSTKKNIITALEVYSEQYNIVGKIDIYDADKKMLIERKRQIKTIYDGYVFQLYAQFFAMVEMGYDIQKLMFHSIVDNKNYSVPLPKDDNQMLVKFETVIRDMRAFSLDGFVQTNGEKCKRCIYEPACDRGLV
ncbi:MAG: type V CRISPR-associated protein Cas4 [Lachnospiraceae bacterium]|nr:type V CRISPR-associated protein Cas4 [Lachnospiraceae bacterium]